MKILITSGGTRIPIDSVRHIGNMSNGTLGSKMATQALKDFHEVIFFHAEKSKSPMKPEIDFSQKSVADNNEAFQEAADMFSKHSHRYHGHSFKGFEDYQEGLKNLIAVYKPDMIVLAAAVSDYAPEQEVQGKIRSKENLTINLKPLPKVISNVREWAGQQAFIVGFKLLLDVTPQDLIFEAKKSIIGNNLNCVCANDLRTVFNGNHKLFVVSDRDYFESSDSDLMLQLFEVYQQKKGLK